MIYFNRWVLLVVALVLAIVVSASQQDTKADEDIVIKRGWKDTSGAWGKRGWNNLQVRENDKKQQPSSYLMMRLQVFIFSPT